MTAGYRPDHWDAVRTGEHEEEPSPLREQEEAQPTDAQLDEAAQQSGLWKVGAPIPDEWRARLRDFLSRAALSASTKGERT